MKSFKTAFLSLATLCLAVILTPSLNALAQSSDAAAGASSDISKKLDELQKQMDSIQAQMAELKKQAGGTGTVSTTAAATTTPAVQSATSTSPAPGGATPETSAPSLATILGPTNITGFVDTYYGYDFNQPHSRNATYRLFDNNTNQFSLNMIELTLAKPPEATNSRLGYNLTFGFGNAMNVVNSTDPGGLGFAQYVKEAYISYLAPVGKGLQIDFGKFVTPAGAEVIETKDNWNYSRSLLFNYAIPFYHFGMRAKYAFNDKYSLTGYVLNGWNDIVDNNSGKTFGASFGWTPTKKWAVTQNFLAGPETFQSNTNWRKLSDTVITYTPTSKLTLMANYDYGWGDPNPIITNPRAAMWTGVAAYVRYAFNERYALASRYEYFDDRDGFATATAQHFNEFTETFERVVAKHLITRWEYRRDMSTRPTFAKGGGLTDHQDTFTGGLVYVFDLKEMH